MHLFKTYLHFNLGFILYNDVFCFVRKYFWDVPKVCHSAYKFNTNNNLNGLFLEVPSSLPENHEKRLTLIPYINTWEV